MASQSTSSAETTDLNQSTAAPAVPLTPVLAAMAAANDASSGHELATSNSQIGDLVYHYNTADRTSDTSLFSAADALSNAVGKYDQRDSSPGVQESDAESATRASSAASTGSTVAASCANTQIATTNSIDSLALCRGYMKDALALNSASNTLSSMSLVLNAEYLLKRVVTLTFLNENKRSTVTSSISGLISALLAARPTTADVPSSDAVNFANASIVNENLGVLSNDFFPASESQSQSAYCDALNQGYVYLRGIPSQDTATHNLKTSLHAANVALSQYNITQYTGENTATSDRSLTLEALADAIIPNPNSTIYGSKEESKAGTDTYTTSNVTPKLGRAVDFANLINVAALECAAAATAGAANITSTADLGDSAGILDDASLADAGFLNSIAAALTKIADVMLSLTDINGEHGYVIADLKSSFDDTITAYRASSLSTNADVVTSRLDLKNCAYNAAKVVHVRAKLVQCATVSEMININAMRTPSPSVPTPTEEEAALSASLVELTKGADTLATGLINMSLVQDSIDAYRSTVITYFQSYGLCEVQYARSAGYQTFSISDQLRQVCTLSSPSGTMVDAETLAGLITTGIGYLKVGIVPVLLGGTGGVSLVPGAPGPPGYSTAAASGDAVQNGASSIQNSVVVSNGSLPGSGGEPFVNSVNPLGFSTEVTQGQVTQDFFHANVNSTPIPPATSPSASPADIPSMGVSQSAVPAVDTSVAISSVGDSSAASPDPKTATSLQIAKNVADEVALFKLVASSKVPGASATNISNADIITGGTSKFDSVDSINHTENAISTVTSTASTVVSAVNESVASAAGLLTGVQPISFDDLVSLAQEATALSATNQEIQCKFEELNAFIAEASIVKDTIKSLFAQINVSVDINSDEMITKLEALNIQYSTLIGEIADLKINLEVTEGVRVHVDAPSVTKVLNGFEQINSSITTYFSSFSNKQDSSITTRGTPAYIASQRISNSVEALKNIGKASAGARGPELVKMGLVLPPTEDIVDPSNGKVSLMATTASNVFANATSKTAALVLLQTKLNSSFPKGAVPTKYAATSTKGTEQQWSAQALVQLHAPAVVSPSVPATPDVNQSSGTSASLQVSTISMPAPLPAVVPPSVQATPEVNQSKVDVNQSSGTSASLQVSTKSMPQPAPTPQEEEPLNSASALVGAVEGTDQSAMPRVEATPAAPAADQSAVVASAAPAAASPEDTSVSGKNALEAAAKAVEDLPANR